MATEFLASSAWWLVHKGNKEDVGDVRWHVKGLQKTSSVLLLATPTSRYLAKCNYSTTYHSVEN